MYLVGGAVRDYIMNQDKIPKDFDFSVEADSYEDMRQWLLSNNFEIFTEKEEFFTIRARRREAWTFASFNLEHNTYDFVLARKDASYRDGRRPDSVSKGTIFDDLARRDFTMNAIAIDKFGKFIDPFDGIRDIESTTIRLVGGIERLYEDGLRILRALRFSVTLDFIFDVELERALRDRDITRYLEGVSLERINDELYKAFSADTPFTLELLEMFPHISNYIFKETDLWLIPTMKKQKNSK
jgi:tRNA nucleotidyltransferase/poly(A) polymerase